MNAFTPEQITERRAAFLAAMKGIPTHHVAYAMGQATPGVVWKGCTKARLAEAYAKRDYRICQDLSQIVANATKEELYAAKHRADRHEPLDWIIKSVLTDDQLALVPPGQKFTLAQLVKP